MISCIAKMLCSICCLASMNGQTVPQPPKSTAASQQHLGPRIEVPAEIDAGVFYVNGERERNVTIRIKNVGDKPLEIPWLLSRCTQFACTDCAKPATPIPAGSFVDVIATIKMNSGIRPGRIFGTIGFESNSVKTPHVWVKITGEMKDSVELVPKHVELTRNGDFLVGKAEMRKVNGSNPNEHCGVVPATFKDVEVQWKKTDDSRSNTLGNILIKIPVAKAIQPGNGSIGLYVDGYIYHQSLAFSWPQAVKLRAQPEQLVFRGMTAAQSKTATIEITGQTPFSIKRVRSQSPYIKVELGDNKPGLRQDVKIVFSPNNNTGVLKGELIIESDLKDEPFIKIPLIALVKSPAKK